jgi:hypothetical protein
VNNYQINFYCEIKSINFKERLFKHGKKVQRSDEILWLLGLERLLQQFVIDINSCQQLCHISYAIAQELAYSYKTGFVASHACAGSKHFDSKILASHKAAG